MGMPRMVVALTSCSLISRSCSQRPGNICSTKILHTLDLVLAARDLVRGAEQHGRAVVHRVVHARAREHQAVQLRNRQADRVTCRLAQHPARRRPVPVDMVPLPPVERRRDDRGAVERIAHMREQAGVENLVEALLVVVPALIFAAQAGAVAGSGLAHGRSFRLCHRPPIAPAGAHGSRPAAGPVSRRGCGTRRRSSRAGRRASR